ncbi:hypothetical protein [Aquimarina algiphila]|uniref:Uncharacterized protein n=1 Tax=Aquimarina algiphila TaxID=2047982 RepID=A0A554VEY1_9FLAO|nr:hypothetical protein [Aquimarina algiphila]TSE05677.1 hypothetical protein FOF46_21860 [Aquimarina algiphila]
MALVTALLKKDIKGILNDLKNDTDQEAAIEKYADQLSRAIETYVKSATVIVTGTSVSGGAVTGTGQIQ